MYTRAQHCDLYQVRYQTFQGPLSIGRSQQLSSPSIIQHSQEHSRLWSILWNGLMHLTRVSHAPDPGIGIGIERLSVVGSRSRIWRLRRRRQRRWLILMLSHRHRHGHWHRHRRSGWWGLIVGWTRLINSIIVLALRMLL